MKTVNTRYHQVKDENDKVLSQREFLNYAGPLLKIKVTNLINGKVREGNGLIDTGATKSSLDPTTISYLEIVPDGEMVTVNAALDGQNEQFAYSNYKIEIPELELTQEIISANAATTIHILPRPYEVISLIGRDILDSCDLHYDGINAMVVISHLEVIDANKTKGATRAPFDFSRITDYPVLQLAFRAFTESKNVITCESATPNPLGSMHTDARMRYIELAMCEVSKVLFSTVMLLNNNAGDDFNESEALFETARDNQKAWFRKLLEGFVEIANFENTNEDIYYRHLVRIREYCTIMGSIRVEKSYFGCENKNKANLCKTLHDSIVQLEEQIDLSKCWYLKEKSRSPFKDRENRATLGQLTPFEDQLKHALNTLNLSAAEKLLFGLSYASYVDASQSIHWSIGVPESFQPQPREGVISGGINQISMMGIAIITRLHKLLDSKNELITMLHEELSESEVSKYFLNEATNKGIEIGDLVAVPYGYATVVKVLHAPYGYRSYEVFYVNNPPIPDVYRDQFTAFQVKLLLKREQVIIRLTEKYKSVFEKVIEGDMIPTEEFFEIMEKSVLKTISKFNKMTPETISSLIQASAKKDSK